MEITIKALNVYNPDTGETRSTGEIIIKTSEEYSRFPVGEKQARELLRNILKEVRERGKEVAYRDEGNEWLIRWKLGSDITVEYTGEDSWSKFKAISLHFKFEAISLYF